MGKETIAHRLDSAPSHQSESFAAAMLVVACLCWAAFFSLCKNWQEAAHACPGGELVASLTLLGVRTLIALGTFVVLKPRLFLKPSRREIGVGLLLGSLNCVGNILQVWGLASTSSALSGFFTSLASLWVPILAFVWLRLGKLVSWLIWLMEIFRQPAVVRDVLLLTMLSTILATHLMSAYQPRVPASRAALIYLLEPVFAAALSIVVGHDSINGRLLLGGTFILAGNALVEVPRWIRNVRGQIGGPANQNAEFNSVQD